MRRTNDDMRRGACVWVSVCSPRTTNPPGAAQRPAIFPKRKSRWPVFALEMAPRFPRSREPTQKTGQANDNLEDIQLRDVAGCFWIGGTAAQGQKNGRPRRDNRVTTAPLTMLYYYYYLDVVKSGNGSGAPSETGF